MDSLIIRPLSYSGFGRQNANQMRQSNMNQPFMSMNNFNGMQIQSLSQPYQIKINPILPAQVFLNQSMMNHPHEQNFTNKISNKQL